MTSNSHLASKIPHLKLDILQIERFDLKSLCRHDLFNTIASNLFKYGGFASIIETKDANPHLPVDTALFSRKLVKKASQNIHFIL